MPLKALFSADWTQSGLRVPQRAPHSITSSARGHEQKRNVDTDGLRGLQVDRQRR
jgi:hypothetical protein